ncbi:MAG: hypothetical protein PVH00_09740 [Gemmatimonadota bacterium]|jgi:hypothetical protein
MRRSLIGFALGAALLAAESGRLRAQAVEQTDTVYRVRLADGSTLYGRVVESSEARVVVLTEAGVRVEVERSQIRDMTPLAGRLVNGQVWPEDANRTRLFFGPTGRALGDGEGYVGLYELFFSFIAVGIGDRVTLAGGTPIFPGAIGDVIYLAPKVTLVNEDRLQFAAGALSFFLTESIDEGSVGIAYGVLTMGSADDAVTLGAGWGFALGGDESSIADEPVIMMGLERRASRSIKLISENYYAAGDLLVSGGIRFLGERFSADVGLAGALGTGDSSFGLPILSVAWRF